MFDNVAVMLPVCPAQPGPGPRGHRDRSGVLWYPTSRPSVNSAFRKAEIEGWFVLLGPAGVPDDIVRRLNAAVNAVLSAPSKVEHLAELGAGRLVGKPEDVTALIVGDRKKWGRVIREAV